MTGSPPIQPDAVAEATLLHLLGLLRKAQSPREAAWAVTSQAIAALGLEDCVVYLSNPDGLTLTQVAVFGPKLKAVGMIENSITLRFGHGIVGHAAEQKTVIRVDDTRLDPRYVLDDNHRLSEIAVPVLDENRVLGVLDSEHSDAGFYTEHHEQVLRQMAELLAARLIQIRSLTDRH
ncbi:MAG: GAF domain-containing protein [Ahniella sp.]|nr:GAF domain-containing protein [Ahniella sp.]